jgi:hypothetical protein
MKGPIAHSYNCLIVFLMTQFFAALESSQLQRRVLQLRIQVLCSCMEKKRGTQTGKHAPALANSIGRSMCRRSLSLPRTL